MSTKKTTKKTNGKATTKTAGLSYAIASTLKIPMPKTGTSMLMSPENAPIQFTGTIHYQAAAAFLDEGGSSSLLIIYRPQGNYSPADVGAAASYLRHIIGKDEGDPAVILGYRKNLFGQTCILIVSAN